MEPPDCSGQQEQQVSLETLASQVTLEPQVHRVPLVPLAYQASRVRRVVLEPLDL